jgi:membrane protein YdbS with pleckstrin-like domain
MFIGILIIAAVVGTAIAAITVTTFWSALLTFFLVAIGVFFAIPIFLHYKDWILNKKNDEPSKKP